MQHRATLCALHRSQQYQLYLEICTMVISLNMKTFKKAFQDSAYFPSTFTYLHGSYQSHSNPSFCQPLAEQEAVNCAAALVVAIGATCVSRFKKYFLKVSLLILHMKQRFAKCMHLYGLNRPLSATWCF